MIDNISDLLPIGSVVMLNNGSKRLMIFGVLQSIKPTKGEPEAAYDYIGVPYPEGNMGQEKQFMFHHMDIAEVFFRGYEDIERQEFIFTLKNYITDKLKQNE